MIGTMGSAVLVAILAAAGLAKLRDREGTESALSAFGAPSPLVGPLTYAVPAAELGIAVLLVPSSTAVAASLAALVLLAVFTAAIAANLVLGRAPECNCFGQLGSKPIGPLTLVRNIVLLVVAGTTTVALASSPDASLGAAAAELEGTGVAGWGLVAMTVGLIGTGWLAFAALRGRGQLLLRIDQLEDAMRSAGIAVPDGERAAGPSVGSPAPAIEAEPLSAREYERIEQRTKLLIFVETGCAPCRALMPEISAWQRAADALAIVPVAAGPHSDVRAAAEEHELEAVLHDDGSRTFTAFAAPATPSAVLVDATGRVASAIAAGPEQIRRLHASAVSANPSPAPPVGSPAPRVKLATLTGEEIDLGEPRGAPTVLVFWNPDCGYCREMLDALRAEGERRARDAGLIIVSRGTAEATEADGFSCPVALDASGEAARAFGARGTPMAVALDGGARVAGPVAAGPREVLAAVARLEGVPA